MLIPMACMLFLAKEPPDQEKKHLGDYLKVIIDKDAWVFNIIYIVSFGGYIGFTTFLPTYFHDQFGIAKSHMGQYSAVIAIMASVLRIVGGAAADKLGGIRLLNYLLIAIAVGAFLMLLQPTLYIAVLIFVLIFSALGAANGSTFQLVPLRFPTVTPVAMSLVGEIGALGGGLLPNAMGISRQYVGNFSGGFAFFGAIAIAALIVLRVVQKRWTTTWIGKHGKVLHIEEKSYDSM